MPDGLLSPVKAQVKGVYEDGLPSLDMINEQTSFDEECKESKTEFASRRKPFPFFEDSNNFKSNEGIKTGKKPLKELIFDKKSKRHDDVMDAPEDGPNDEKYSSEKA